MTNSNLSNARKAKNDRIFAEHSEKIINFVEI